MQNPIMQTIGRRNQINPVINNTQTQFSRFKQVLDLMKNSNNPGAIVQRLAMQNPQFVNAIQQAQQYANNMYGGNYQQAINSYSKQLGIDLTGLFN